ncbi:Hypothetical protein NTJ_03452 [Nesidiocoris tenuis]|uniref:Uncharacterized protein n=2 Tax=Nesidiocoris tenuis TaxID=355587 RepID=A0ABN7AHG2_9HEMI|nr:Hypothetical protein NTJ_03452 [Nesidiocoris tenuis]
MKKMAEAQHNEMTNNFAKLVARFPIPHQDMENLLTNEEGNTTNQVMNLAVQRKVPNYLESLINDVPPFKTDDPDAIIGFLEALYDVQLTADEYFEDIVKRMAATKDSKNLKRLINDSKGNLTFDYLAKKILSEFTNPRIKMQYTVDYILRSQKPNESFRDYVDSVMKFGLILKTHSTSELIQCAIDGVNTRTRSFFHFQTIPTTLEDLEKLINEVEKLERNNRDSMRKSREDLSDLRKYCQRTFPGRRSSDNNRFVRFGEQSGYQKIQQTPHQQYMGPQQYQMPQQYPSAGPWGHSFPTPNERPINRGPQETSTKPSAPQNFKANNPNWNKKFANQQRITYMSQPYEPYQFQHLPYPVFYPPHMPPTGWPQMSNSPSPASNESAENPDIKEVKQGKKNKQKNNQKN